MTRRVFECDRPSSYPAPLVQRRPDPRTTARGLRAATLTALVLVPLAGAAEPPQGWTAATLAALVVLLLVPMLGGGAPWGWLALLMATAGLVMPRNATPAVGPGFLVATVLCVIIWLANRRAGQRGLDARPRPGSAAHDAQLLMGFRGEQHVREVLARDLPDEFVLINGLKLPRGAGDIDHLVIGPTGVFVVETKTMAGRIVCEADGTWRRTRLNRDGTSFPAYIGNPATQVHRNILAARECLRRRAPWLFHEPSLWLEGLVVFPHPRTELAADHSRIPAVRVENAVALIRGHAPRRSLQPADVDAIADALLNEVRVSGHRVAPVAQSAQALVEAALALPVVLSLVFGALALSRIVQAQTAVIAVAHEAARAGALASAPDEAVARLRSRAELVAPGLGLNPTLMTIEWDVGHFAQDPGQVRVAVRYTVDLADLPLVGWSPSPTVGAQHVEWVDPFRSGLALAGGGR